MSFPPQPMPKLLGADWTHLFPAPSAQPAAGKTPAQCFSEFQAELSRLADEADAYNAAAPSRAFPDCFPMYVMNPRVLETSSAV
mmetsp:Transcript_58697/g.162434  ORF Transcript_58697/g.162434 Transcript_58697/m.162434 type:complete len:84 (+) Transcript_58697:1-252(+)